MPRGPDAICCTICCASCASCASDATTSRPAGAAHDAGERVQGGGGNWKGLADITPHVMGYMGAWAKAWCLLTHAAAFPSHGGQGEPGASLNLPLRLCHRGQDESLVPPYTRGRVPLTGMGQSLVPPYTRGRVSLTGAKRKPSASLYSPKRLSLYHGIQGQSLVPPLYTRGSVSLSFDGGQGESLEPPYSRGSISLSPSLSARGAGRTPVVSLYTRKHLCISLLAVLHATSHPGGYCSPRHRMPLSFKKHGSKCVA